MTMKSKIRAIRAGDVFAGKLISVNQILQFGDKTMKVVEIREDREFLERFGYTKFEIYIQEAIGFGPILHWQDFLDQSMSVTYECL
jgi:hypothetical protein